MIQFKAGEDELLRVEKMNKLAGEVERLAQQSPPPFSAPAGFAAVRRIYIDPATDELVLVTSGGERRYAAVP
jgi:hypothetical protein